MKKEINGREFTVEQGPLNFDKALDQEKKGIRTDYKTYMYKVIGGDIEAFVCDALKAEQSFDEGWRMSIIDAWEMHDPEHIKKLAEQAIADHPDGFETSKEEIFKEVISDGEEELNKLLNIDKIESIDVLKSIATAHMKDGKPLDSFINWNIKGKRKLQHIVRDLKKQLDSIGQTYGDSTQSH